MNACLLTLIATPELEERIIDFLLESGHLGFTSLPCRGHGIQAARLSAAEQVAGVERRVAFWIQTSQEGATSLVAELAQTFAGTGLHYWISPVTEGGRIGESAEPVPSEGPTFHGSEN